MLQRQSPFFKDLNDLFESKWVPFATPAHQTFPMDIIERDDEFEVRVAVPGAKKENLSVTLEKGSLHISVSGGEKDDKENQTAHQKKDKEIESLKGGTMDIE